MSESGSGDSAGSPNTSRGRRPGGALACGAVAFATALPLVGAEPASLPALVEQFDHLAVGSAARVGPLTLSAGHVECRLQSGNAAAVLAGDEVVGVFFEGTGSVEYVSADPIEALVVVFNAKKGSSLKPEKTDKGISLRDGLQRVLREIRLGHGDAGGLRRPPFSA